MRYTHNLRLIRRRKHTGKISLFLTASIIILVLLLGFTELDAKQFFLGFFESLLRVCIAYIISILLAITLTLFATSSEKVESLTIPILDVMQSFPSFALFPLLVVWFGKTAIVTIFILIITMIWPILFTLLSAKKQIRSDLLEAAQSFGATKVKFLQYVLFPLLFSAIITGSIVSWGEAWEVIIAAEIIVAIPGVGTYLAESGTNNNSQILLIGIILLLAMLFIINKYLWLPLLNLGTKYQQE